MKVFGFPFDGILETVGGLAIVLGLLTRPVAPVLFCFLYLYLTFAGAGVWSLDALLARHKRRPPLAWRVVREPEPWGRLNPS